VAEPVSERARLVVFWIVFGGLFLFWLWFFVTGLWLSR
jgi:hypothetical protein